MNGRKIVVTGGLGFIGSHFIDLLLGRCMDDGVTVLDADTYCGSQKNLERHIRNEALTIYGGSVCDGGVVHKTIESADVVIHFAAETHVDRSLTNIRIFYETNILGTLNVLEACRQENVEKIVIVSSDEVYGDCYSPAIEASSLFRPKNPYAVSKAAADMSARSYYHTYSLPVCVVRPVNNYGPRQYPEKLIPKFIVKMLAGEKVPVYGDGRNTREWLYVTDTCNAILSLIDREDYRTLIAGEVFNIGSGVERSVIEITRMLSSILDVHDESIVEYVDDRAGHVIRHRVDWNKLHETVGWKPLVSFRDGMERTVRWYREKHGGDLENWWES